MGCQRLGCNYYTGKIGVTMGSPVLVCSAAKLPGPVVMGGGGEPLKVQKWETRSAVQVVHGSSALVR